MADFLPFVQQRGQSITPGIAPIETSQAPVSHVSGAEVEQPYSLLSNSLNKIGEGLEAVATPLAERAGAQAVTRNDDGSIQVDKAPIFGEAGAAFSRAAKVTALADVDGAAKRADIDLRQQHLNDPQGYQAAAEAFKQRTVADLTASAGPEVGVAAGQAIESATTYTYRSLLNKQQEKIRVDFDKSTDAAITSKTQDLIDLIRTGGANQPDAKKLASEIHTLQQERVSNPVLGEPQEVADLRIKQLNQQIFAAGAEYKVNSILKGSSPYQPTIDAAAQKYGINPVLLGRQIHQESGFDPNAVSSAGATGIAQFMPGTARQYGVNPRDPNSSIEGAAHYMSDLNRQFGGNYGLALAGYNWGPGNVAAWMSSGANPAAMPPETRNYVQAITGQPIEKWLAGQHPDPAAIAGLDVPEGAQGSVQRAYKAVQAMRDDQSVDPAQRLLNYQAGLKAINDFRENNIRMANVNAEQQKQIDNAFENKVIADSASPNPTITEYDVKTEPGLSAESRMRMLGWLKRDGMPEPLARTSQSTAMDLFQRMNLPDGDPNKLTDTAPIRNAFVSGNLTRADEDWLEKRFAEGSGGPGAQLGKVRAQFSKAVDAVIDTSNPLLGKIDASGKMQAYAFERFVDQKVNEYQQAKKNPLDLFDPTKPDYLGKPEIVQKFKVPLQQSIQNIVGNLTGGNPTSPAPVPQRLPNETPAAYLARINGAK